MKDFPENDIRQEVFNLDFDLKAETLLSYIEEDTQVDLSLSDFFKRRFSKDITLIEKDRYNDDTLNVHLSRRSFYNVLPERFFHSTYISTPFVNTMVADYHGRKIEQENALKFFKPLETEFFLHRVDIESAENEILTALGSPKLVDFLMDLWKIDERIPKRMAAKILKTMPFMYKIAGNIPLLKRILENIIEEEILIEKDFATAGLPVTNEPWQLGVNMATSGKQKTFLPKYIFTMNNISRPENIEDYLPDGKITAVVNFFLEHTLPHESDFEINFRLPKRKTRFIMTEDAYSGRLGISATI
ncbi:hypothetical protein SAMN05421766_10730 [Zobellia uliginosa]|uniref:Type VI secretion, VasB, ImpH, VC_A0111 n=1 Tax=Zobellia uliginosa TaxID=143224 RepID=A0ABY1L0F2_9FLAO|nr:hypothetical protein [Zobellia uliginosa]MDO6519058.1 hypothetical protein [Zobellia uliginosa]SIT01638.1 hypothetical protein SAMN05421766_10730 [Zobellia uliginosa]